MGQYLREAAWVPGNKVTPRKGQKSALCFEVLLMTGATEAVHTAGPWQPGLALKAQSSAKSSSRAWL